MFEGLGIKRENFPHSKVKAEGMISIIPEVKRFEIGYIQDVIYKTVENKSLKLQILRPWNAKELLPVLIYIPGSAFHTQNVYERIPQGTLFSELGYVVALLEYRGSEDAVYPALIEDAQDGIKFMVQHAKEFCGSSEKIYIAGDSSGAHTAMASVLMWNEKNGNNPVKGVIDFYGPTNLSVMNNEPSSQNHTTKDSPEGLILGGITINEKKEMWEKANLLNYVTSKSLPPFLMIHGTNDELVPFGQSCMLYEKLKKFNHQAALYAIENAHHGGSEFLCEQVIDIVRNFIR